MDFTLDFLSTLDAAFFWKVVNSLGGIVAIVLALVGATYWLFQAFADKWLQAKFDGRLEALRHEQNRELEHLRFTINAMMDRTTKLHEREYQTLPELWQLLVSAWGEVGSFISQVQTVSDVNRMGAAALEEELSRSPLFESQKQAVRDSTDKTLTYDNELYWHKKHSVENTAREFTRSLRFNGIFVLPEIKRKMLEANGILWAALEEHEFNHAEKPRPRERVAHKRFTSDGKTLLDGLEVEVQERLWSVRKLD